MSSSRYFETFAARLRAFIRATAGGEPAALIADPADCAEPAGSFEQLALELFALQLRHNPVYRDLCAHRGISRAEVNHWSEIPAVSTAAFKEFDLTSLAPAERTAGFYSSGTTGHAPSRHFHSPASLALYEASLWPWFARHFLPAVPRPNPLRVLALAPAQATVPHSSLVHMFDFIGRQSFAQDAMFAGRLESDGSWSLDLEKTTLELRRAVEQQTPFAVLGTAFSFVHLLDFLAEHELRFQLPAGSRAIETGGYKGRSRSLPRHELHQGISERLGLPSAYILCEYGMSELSSQAYDHVMPAAAHARVPVVRRFAFPPWARALVVSPETGTEVRDGETGLLRVFDLANVFSVMAIQTEDLAVRRGNGFELLGRALMAEPRGCSLMASSIG